MNEWQNWTEMKWNEKKILILDYTLEFNNSYPHYCLKQSM